MELQVFTLNCWGIPCVSKDRKPRMRAIAEALANQTYDIVCLQEVWSDDDFNLIREATLAVLPHSHYFYSGVVGSGVCILSRYPITEVFFHKWSVNGYIHKIQHGDWFGGKGVGLCCLKINGFKVNIYSAHLHAEYNRASDEYMAHRVLQAYDTAQFIQLTSACADSVILAGDLNTEPGDLAYRILTNITGLSDAYLEAGECDEIAATNEDYKNSYSSGKSIKDKIPGKRIDYVMYHGNTNIDVSVTKYCQPFPSRVPRKSYSYSDHDAICATLTLAKSEKSDKSIDNDRCFNTLTESITICEDYLRRLGTHKTVYFIAVIIMLGLIVTTFVTDDPFGYTVIYHISRVILTFGIIFALLMGTLWNMIERNSVVAGNLALKVALSQLATNSNS